MLFIIQARTQCGLKPLVYFVAHYVGCGICWLYRVVYDYKICPAPRKHSANRCSVGVVGGKLNLPLDGTSHGTVDVVLSDMAPNTVGHKKTDHIRQMVLLEYAFDFACRALKPGGVFVAKSFTGGTTGDLLKQIKERFETVHHIKPPASRKDSVEMFIVALGFKG